MNLTPNRHDEKEAGNKDRQILITNKGPASKFREAKFTDDESNEFVLLSDVTGVSELVEKINHVRPQSAGLCGASEAQPRTATR
jgi:Catechol dioxygenase N terminus